MLFREGRFFWAVAAGVVVFILSRGSTQGAVATDDVVGAAGDVVTQGSMCLTFTVGEAVVEGGVAGGIVVTDGFRQPSSYDFWSVAQHLTSGPLADADGDGLPNLLEYAYGTNPLSPASTARVEGSIGPGGKLYLTKSKGTSAADLLWSAVASPDLVNWSPLNVSVALNDTATFSALYTGNAPAFMLLRLDLLRSK